MDIFTLNLMDIFTLKITNIKHVHLNKQILTCVLNYILKWFKTQKAVKYLKICTLKCAKVLK